MRLYFKHVIWGVLIRPKKAIEYALNHSTPLNLTLLILINLFINNFFISNYFTIVQLFLFGLFFSLLYAFSKIMKTKANARDILYVILLINLCLLWVELLIAIAFSIIIIILFQLDPTIDFFSAIQMFLDSPVNIAVGAISAFIDHFGDTYIILAEERIPVVVIYIVGLHSSYFLYTLVQLLNKVQKVSIIKSVTIVLLSVLTLILMISKGVAYLT